MELYVVVENFQGVNHDAYLFSCLEKAKEKLREITGSEEEALSEKWEETKIFTVNLDES